ncbi:MAG: hypothetical protein R3D66_00445 [Alphaproteobacteria bacterium]
MGSGDLSFSSPQTEGQAVPAFDGSSQNGNIFETARSNVGPVAMDRAVDSGESPNIDAVVTDGQFSHGAIGSIGASALSSDKGVFSATSSASVGDTGADISEIHNSDSTTINNNTNINNTTNGDTIQNAVSTVGDTIGDVFNLGGDIIENIINGDIDLTQIVNTLTEDITQITNIAGDIWNGLNLDEILNFGDVLNLVVNNEAVTELTEVVSTTINNTLDTLTGDLTGLLDDGVIALHLDDTLLSGAGLNLDLSLSDTLSGGLDVTTLTGGAGDLILEATGLDLPLLSDVQASIGFDLLGGGGETDNAQGDTDIALNGLDNLGLDIPDIALDPVEALVGDIDIALDIPEELTDPGALVQDVQDIVGNLDTLDLGGLGDIPDLLGGEGSEGTLGIEILDVGMDQNLDMTLDDLTEGALDNLPGDSLEGVGNAVEDLIGLDDALEILPEMADTGLESGLEDALGLDLSASQDTESGDNLADGLLDIVDDVLDQTDSLLDGLTGEEDVPDLQEINDLTGDLAENLTNDLTEDLVDALDLLSGGVEESNDSSGLDDGIWTDIGDTGGGLFDDIISGDLGGDDVLPDPTGGVAEGLEWSGYPTGS